MTDRPVITTAVLDQWAASALVDAETGDQWSIHPLAILAIVDEVRAARAATDDCADYLRAQAEALATQAEAANRRPATRPHAAVLQRNANSCAFAAGVLRNRTQTEETTG